MVNRALKLHLYAIVLYAELPFPPPSPPSAQSRVQSGWPPGSNVVPIAAGVADVSPVANHLEAASDKNIALSLTTTTTTMINLLLVWMARALVGRWVTLLNPLA